MIQFQNVSKFYKGNLGINNINFEIEAGKVVLFIGQNGSGKSTCLKLIAKTIFLDKRDQGQIKNGFSSISYLPEKFALPSLIKTTDFLTNIANLHGIKVDVNKMLNKYQIPNKYICNLSKGMLQKLGIVMTLITPGELFLFDEPTDGLDEASRKIFKDDIMKLSEENKTIIISTHNRSYFKDLSTKIYKFSGGIICR